MVYLLVGFVIGVALGWLLDWYLTREDIRSLRETTASKDEEIERLKAALAASETRSPHATAVSSSAVAAVPAAPMAPPKPEWHDPLTGQPVEAYCVKCRAKRTIDGPRRVSLSNGRPAVQGTCPVCRSTLFRIVKL